MIEWKGVFLIIDKHQYIQRYLNQIDRYYSDIDYKSLNEIRVSSSLRHRADTRELENNFPMRDLGNGIGDKT